MDQRPFIKVCVTAKAERALKEHHPWVYSDEVTDVLGSYENGDIVDVISPKGRWLGSGFINDHSKLRVRILSQNTNDRFDESFWERRLRYAVDYRRTVMGSDLNACRLIFGEADGIPGLTVDRFENVLVTQCLCLGTELIKETLFHLLLDILKEYGMDIQCIYERNDVAVREKEGLQLGKGFFCGSGTGHVTITENNVRYDVDYIDGQKTGFFLDQKYNRRAAAKLARGKSVLDCFTHTGSFALNCSLNGARNVTALDISKDALSTAQHNAELNDADINFICTDVFDFLTEKLKNKERSWDFIILDPPAFTKSSSTVKNAARGYKDINYRAMKLLPRGGYLATCSCSHFMTDELFEKMLASAAQDAQVTLRQIEQRHQAPDHPIAWNAPETAYLKFYTFQVV